MSSRIVVVDDDLEVLSLLHDALAPQGYRVACASTTETGLRAVHQERPGLIILDLHVETPGAGWRLAARLRAEARTADIPIIACSADHRALDARSSWLAQRGIAPLEKPFDLDALLALVAAVGPAGDERAGGALTGRPIELHGPAGPFGVCVPSLAP